MKNQHHIWIKEGTRASFIGHAQLTNIFCLAGELAKRGEEKTRRKTNELLWKEPHTIHTIPAVVQAKNQQQQAKTTTTSETVEVSRAESVSVTCVPVPSVDPNSLHMTWEDDETAWLDDHDTFDLDAFVNSPPIPGQILEKETFALLVPPLSPADPSRTSGSSTSDSSDSNLSGFNALHLAAHSGHHSMVHILLNHRPQDTNSVTSDGNGQSALHLAAAKGYHDVVATLLDLGADALMRNGKGQTAMHLAAANGSKQAVKLLLDRCGEIFNIPDFVGQTPLHQAVIQGQVEIVTLLLERGTDPQVVVV